MKCMAKIAEIVISKYKMIQLLTKGQKSQKIDKYINKQNIIGINNLIIILIIIKIKTTTIILVIFSIIILQTIILELIIIIIIMKICICHKK